MTAVPRRALSAALLGALLLPALSAARAGEAGGAPRLPAGARISERLVGVPGLPNAGRMAPGIYRGAQPGPEGFESLARMGIKTVVNLRYRHSDAEPAKAAGLDLVEIPLNPFARLDRETADRIVDLLADPARRPVFLHCKHGSDRTGVIVAVYRMREEEWSREAAVEEMQAFGFHDIWVNLMSFVKSYPAEGEK